MTGTVAAALDAARDVTVAAFAGSGYALRDTPPDATKVPAVWVQLAAGRQQNRSTVVTVETVAVMANQVNVATEDRLADAADRLIAAWAAGPRDGWSLSGWSFAIGATDIGGADYPTLTFTATVDVTYCKPQPIRLLEESTA